MDEHLTLKMARKLSGLTLQQVSSALNIDKTTLYRYEEGDIKKIPPQRMEQLLSFYRERQPPYNSQEAAPGLERMQQQAYYATHSLLQESAHYQAISQDLLQRINALDLRGKQSLLYHLLREEERLIQRKEGPAQEDD